MTRVIHDVVKRRQGAWSWYFWAALFTFLGGAAVALSVLAFIFWASEPQHIIIVPPETPAVARDV